MAQGLADDTGPVFCLLLGVSSDYAQPITGQVTEVTCPVIGWAQPELTLSKRQKMGPGNGLLPVWCQTFIRTNWPLEMNQKMGLKKNCMKKKVIWKCCLQGESHFIQGSMCHSFQGQCMPRFSFLCYWNKCESRQEFIFHKGNYYLCWEWYILQWSVHLDVMLRIIFTILSSSLYYWILPSHKAPLCHWLSPITCKLSPSWRAMAELWTIAGMTQQRESPTSSW